MLAQLPNNSYICKCKDSSGVATLRKGQTDSLSLLSFVGITYNVGSMNKEQEIWKPVVGFEGYYEVSNLGRVRSLDRTVIRSNGIVQTLRGKVKDVKNNAYGYPCVTLCKDGISRQTTLHRIIAEAFIPNPDNKPEIDHINTIREDFRLENLRWVSHKENMHNPISKERVYINSHTKEATKKNNATKVARNRKTAPKRVYQFTLNGEFVAEYESAREAERITGLDAITIAAVSRGGLRGRQSRGGYLWSRSREIIPQYEPYKKKLKPILQYTKDGEFVKRWDSIKSACEALGVLPSNIARCASGKKKCLCGGYLWKYEK